MKPAIEMTAKEMLRELKLRGSVMTRAKQLAMNEVKHELRKAGRRLTDYKALQLKEMASEWLALHPGTYERARFEIASW
jgi:hypothetical protein